MLTAFSVKTNNHPFHLQMLLHFEALEAIMNLTIVETDDVEDKVDQVQTVEIEESFKDMNEDTVETDYVVFLVLRNQAEKSVIQNTN